MQPALARLEAQKAVPTVDLLLVASDCAERLGERAAHDRCLTLLAQHGDAGGDRGSVLFRQARRVAQLGDTAKAARVYAEAAGAFRDAGQEREWTIARGGVADILMARGALDEALALHEERLPGAQKMRDIESIAHIRYSMALIRLRRGECRPRRQPARGDGRQQSRVVVVTVKAAP